MERYESRYGTLHNVRYAEYDGAGQMRRCILSAPSCLKLDCGVLVPQYQEEAERKKLRKSVTFYPNGTIESVVLQERTDIRTRVGTFPGEMVTFYENGAVKRIFPVFSTISAYWTERDEYRLSPEISLPLPFGSFCGKVINLFFYDTGELKGATLWPRETIEIAAGAGMLKTRVGFTLYPGGAVKSLEPALPCEVATPIGILPAFDPDALGIDGENNSLVFDEYGAVCSLMTVSAQIRVRGAGGEPRVFAPSFRGSDYFDDRQAVVALKVVFTGTHVRFFSDRGGRPDAEFALAGHSFAIEPFDFGGCANTCGGCDE